MKPERGRFLSVGLIAAKGCHRGAGGQGVQEKGRREEKGKGRHETKVRGREKR